MTPNSTAGKRTVGRKAVSPRAQATVETAIVIPVIVFLLVVLVQVVVVVRDQVHVVRVTSAAARAAMVEPNDLAARAAADSVKGDLDVQRVTLSGTRHPGGLLKVSVAARPQRLPIVGLALSGVQLSEQLTVRVEG